MRGKSVSRAAGWYRNVFDNSKCYAGIVGTVRFPMLQNRPSNRDTETIPTGDRFFVRGRTHSTPE